MTPRRPRLRPLLTACLAVNTALLLAWMCLDQEWFGRPWRHMTTSLIAVGLIGCSILAIVLVVLVVRGRAAEAKSTEAKFRSLLDAAPDPMVIINGDGLVTLVNARAEELFQARARSWWANPWTVCCASRAGGRTCSTPPAATTTRAPRQRSRSPSSRPGARTAASSRWKSASAPSRPIRGVSPSASSVISRSGKRWSVSGRPGTRCGASWRTRPASPAPPPPPGGDLRIPGRGPCRPVDGRSPAGQAVLRRELGEPRGHRTGLPEGEPRLHAPPRSRAARPDLGRRRAGLARGPNAGRLPGGRRRPGAWVGRIRCSFPRRVPIAVGERRRRDAARGVRVPDPVRRGGPGGDRMF